MSLNAKSLIVLIKKLVKEEIKRTLKEAVKNEVNAILAERFVSSLGQKEVFSEVKKSEPTVKKQNFEKRDENRRKELLKKIGVDENPMLEMIYSDVSPAAGGQPIVLGGQAVYVDSDDDGVDLNIFGLGDD